MQNLRDILYSVVPDKVIGSLMRDVRDVVFDSRNVAEGSLFVAVRGTKTDGHNFLAEVSDKGVAAIVCEEFPAEIKEGITYVKVLNSASALAKITENFYGNPSSRMDVIGVTGTNGKTSVATLLFRLFRALGYNVGLISTVQNQINDTIVSSTHTTPDPVQLSKLMAEMVQKKCKYCFMEVSSHAVHQYRVAGIKFAGGIFTNISHDHLDYHQTFDNYIEAKKMFFDDLPSSAFALVNADDKRGMVMLQNTRAKKHTFALRTMADFKARILENSFSGLVLQLDGLELHVRLIGEFNAYNLLAVYAAATLLGEDKTEVMSVISDLKTAEGRFDYIISEREKVVGIVDYAHTPDALKNVLQTIAAVRTTNETLITVVGCGGDRDKAKRPEMAKIAAQMSDRIILTSDNPRSEDPAAIIEDMKVGITPDLRKKMLVIENRKEAIRTACSIAAGGDIILLAGKGHEKYQEIQGVKHPFDDKLLLTETLQELEK